MDGIIPKPTRCKMTNRFEDTADFDELRSQGEEAIVELFDRYRGGLLRMIMLRLDSRLRGKVDGEDILQDVFAEAARRIRGRHAQPSAPFFVWLRQIAIQILIDTHRRYLGARMRDVNLEVALCQVRCGDPSSAFHIAQLADSLTTPSQFAIREEMISELRIALEKLEKIDREVLVLRHLEELSNNEVAHILGIDKSAASKRYVRALERLRIAMPVYEEV